MQAVNYSHARNNLKSIIKDVQEALAQADRADLMDIDEVFDKVFW